MGCAAPEGRGEKGPRERRREGSFFSPKETRQEKTEKNKILIEWDREIRIDEIDNEK